MSISNDHSVHHMAMFCVYSHSTRVYLELLTLFRADEEVGLYMIAIGCTSRSISRLALWQVAFSLFSGRTSSKRCDGFTDCRLLLPPEGRRASMSRKPDASETSYGASRFPVTVEEHASFWAEKQSSNVDVTSHLGIPRVRYRCLDLQ